MIDHFACLRGPKELNGFETLVTWINSRSLVNVERVFSFGEIFSWIWSTVGSVDQSNSEATRICSALFCFLVSLVIGLDHQLRGGAGPTNNLSQFGCASACSYYK